MQHAVATIERPEDQARVRQPEHVSARPLAEKRGGERVHRPTIDDFEVSLTAPAVQLKRLDTALVRVRRAVVPGWGDEVQKRAKEPDRDEDAGQVRALAARGTQGAGGALPFLERIQAAFGDHDVSAISAHVGRDAAEACEGMGAVAYASGERVAFKDAPTLHTAAHEASHVVQQRAGVALEGGVGQVGDVYERHADAVADAVVRGDSAEGLLDSMAGRGGAAAGGVQQAVQRKPGDEEEEEEKKQDELDDGEWDATQDQDEIDAQEGGGPADDTGEVGGEEKPAGEAPEDAGNADDGAKADDDAMEFDEQDEAQAFEDYEDKRLSAFVEMSAGSKTVARLFFKFNEREVLGTNLPVLARLAQALVVDYEANPPSGQDEMYTLSIIGHACKRGPTDKNPQVAEARARNVFAALGSAAAESGHSLPVLATPLVLGRSDSGASGSGDKHERQYDRRVDIEVSPAWGRRASGPASDTEGKAGGDEADADHIVQAYEIQLPSGETVYIEEDQADATCDKISAALRDDAAKTLAIQAARCHALYEFYRRKLSGGGSEGFVGTVAEIVGDTSLRAIAPLVEDAVRASGHVADFAGGGREGLRTLLGVIEVAERMVEQAWDDLDEYRTTVIGASSGSATFLKVTATVSFAIAGAALSGMAVAAGVGAAKAAAGAAAITAGMSNIATQAGEMAFDGKQEFDWFAFLEAMAVQGAINAIVGPLAGRLAGPVATKLAAKLAARKLTEVAIKKRLQGAGARALRGAITDTVKLLRDDPKMNQEQFVENVVVNLMAGLFAAGGAGAASK